MEGKFSLLFEDPYWVGYFERRDETGFQVARFLFGAEPGDAELIHFCLHDFDSLKFSAPVEESEKETCKAGFKRRQRELRSQVAQTGVGTYAQRVIQAEMEQQKKSHEAARREIERENSERAYEKRLQKKKQKKLGH